MSRQRKPSAPGISAPSGQPRQIPRKSVKLKRRNPTAELRKSRFLWMLPAGGLPLFEAGNQFFPLSFHETSQGFQGQSSIGRKGSLCSSTSDLPQTQTIVPNNQFLLGEDKDQAGASCGPQESCSPGYRFSVSLAS